MSESAGFCCDMTAMTREERGRYEILRGKLEAAAVGVEELADGYALRLGASAIAAEELEEWTSFEKKCCPFLTLTTEGHGETMRLGITGRTGVKEFIRAEFGAIRFES
jgi:hypothetical protein